ncbi:MAG: ferrous iron transport protein B [Anaerolineales bacterium]
MSIAEPKQQIGAEQATASLTIALAGQPNVGKSTIFNLLTGLSQHVGNWPGKTVEQKIGQCAYEGYDFEMVDLPGAYSLTANSEEERITRDYIIHEQPDVVVAVVDAAIPERSLYLLSELLLLPAPIVLALNMMDVAEKEGVHIKPEVLERVVGIPIVPTSAAKNRGVREILDAIIALAEGAFDYSPRRPTILPAHQSVLEEIVALIADQTPAPYPTDWVALKLLEGDEEMIELMRVALPADIWSQIHRLLHKHEDAILDIAGARYEWIVDLIHEAVERPKVGQVGLTARLDQWLTHPLWGTGVLIAVLGLVFWLTYSVGTPILEWLEQGVSQIGVMASYSLIEAGAPTWAGDLLADGIIGGAGMVITFLPILIIFFFVLGFLEDTGYMARAAYLTDRFMHLMGLHGKSFMPLLLGFGCNVPAILGARIIETWRARLLTMMIAPLIPCTAQMAVVTMLAAVFFGKAGGWVAWGLVVTNLAVLAGLGIFFHHFVFEGEQAAFIMELPLYHLPNPRTIALYVWQNIVAFLQKAGSVILIASLVIWALSYFPSGGDVMTSYLARVGQWMAPLGELMGLPWPFMVALISSFVAKENTIATLGILYGDLSVTLPTVISWPAALAFLVVQMLFVPCVATVIAFWQEARSWKWPLINLGVLLALSLSAGILVYQLGSWLGG